MKLFKHVLLVFSIVLFGGLLNCHAGMPGYKNVYGPQITPEEAHKLLLPQKSGDKRAVLNNAAASSDVDTAPEALKSLVRGLDNDPERIYAFVHDNIRYTALFGDVKGAGATLTDRSGNSFDQASLMIAMLRQAGFTANYVYGTIRLTPEETLSWLGTNRVATLLRLLPSAGIPCRVYAYSAEQLAYLDVDHVWVKVNIDGTDYAFAPALKEHIHYSGIDLKTVTGFDTTQFVNSALTGTSTGATWIQNVSKTNISSRLSTMAMNLVDHVRTTLPDATLNEIIGGSEIIKSTEAPRRESLPCQQSITAEWTQIPDSFKTTLRIQHRGIDQTFYSSDIYGKRLTLFYNDTNQPELRLDGSLIATGTAATAGTSQSVSVAVDHPYPGGGGSYADASGTIYIRAGGSYVLVNGWGEISRSMVEKHRKLLARNRHGSQSQTAEPVLGESLAMLSSQWLAQCSRMDELTGPLTGTHIIHHHWIGVCGQNDSPYIDMPVNLTSVISLESDEAMETSVFVNASGHHSAFEWGIIDQTQPAYTAVSTVKLIDRSNAKADKIFEADSSNFSTVKTLLESGTYSSSELSHIQSYINAGYRVILPGDGNLGEDSWQGTGFLTVSSDASNVGHIISGGFKGGFGTEAWILDGSDLTGSGETGEDSDAHAQSPEPIDLVTGDYLYAHPDLTLGSSAPPLGLVFSRSYTSAGRFSQEGLGLGWTHNFNIHARIKSDGFQAMGRDAVIDASAVISEILASASILSQGITRDNLVVATIAHRWAMDRMIDNMVQVSMPGTSDQFIKLADGTFNPPNGNADELEILADGTIQVLSKYGKLSLYNTDGTIRSITDPNGNALRFSYADGRLSQVETDTGHSLAFTYDGEFLSRVEDETSRKVTYTYDSAGNLSAFSDPADEATTYMYADDGLLSEIFYPTDPENAFVTNQYDGVDKVSSQTDAAGNTYLYGFTGVSARETNPDGKAAVWTFDSLGHTLSSTDALGNTTQKIYDGLGRLVKTIKPQLNEIELEYDADHNVLLTRLNPIPDSGLDPVETRFTYGTDFNRMTSATDALGRVTDYSYDDKGNLIHVEYPAVGGTSPAVSYAYNPRGQIQTVTDPENKITQNTYDPGSGDLIQTIDDFGGKHITLAWAYDAVGNRTAATDPNGNITTLYYDNLRQVTAEVAPSPFEFETRYSYDESGHPLEVSRRDSTRGNQWVSWATAYTPTFKKKSETDPDGDTIQYEYDSVDRLCKITDPEGHTTRFAYDDAGRLIRKIDDNGDTSETYTYTANGLLAGITDGNQNTTLFEYDGLDRLTAKQYPDETREIFTRDAAGNITEKQTRAGDTITFAYDPLNRLSEKATPEKTVDFSYDLAGRMVSADDGNTLISYTYDTAARLVSVARSDGKVIGKAYDDAGNLIQLTYPDGYYLDYSYDSLNRLEEIVEAGTTTLAAYTYDSLSRRSSTTFNNGVTTTISYEPDNDISAMAFLFSDQAVTFDYTYDQAGKRVTFAATDNRFVYNPLASETKTYTVNNLNQYTDINTITPAYDLNGNMVSKGPAAFDYDSENRLIEAITGGATSSYTSGPMGRRQSKTVNTDTTTYFYDGGNVIMEYDHAGAMAKRFVYGPMVDEPVCMITPSARYYYHADALGSVVALSDASGSISETYAYSPFGKTNDSRTFGNPYLFTGRRIDSESGLYYYRARHYDPQEGRFMQPDPIGFDGGINLYTYVQNNPVNWIDPSGLDTYRQNRVLGFLDSKGTATTAPATHTFIYTTNSDGSLNHTYSWGNVYDDQKRGLWRKDRPEDVRAANQAIQNKNVRGEKIGDASLDPYIEKVFTEWRDDPNHSSRHKWKLFNNCKTEATNLTNEASSQKAKAGK